MTSRPELARRFAARIEELGVPLPGEGAVVAVSGGVDSLVLLHLLRFGRPVEGPSALVAAHLDHRMRPESGRDALWLRGLFRAWEVDARFGAVDQVPSSEEEARDLRYRFLDEVRGEVGARWVLTAHHADDQAETVLFRILRGTGPGGLGGIPERREPGILRPLLPFWKEEIRRYARSVGLRPRIDSTNRDRRYARNVIRQEVLPRIEERVAPGARAALVRLAELSRRDEAAWESVEAELRVRVVAGGDGSNSASREGDAVPEEGGLVILRDPLLELHPGARARVLRSLLADGGIRLDEAGTRGLLAFTSESASGTRLDLPGKHVLTRDFDRFTLRSREEHDGASEDLVEGTPLEIVGPGSGDGSFRVGGRLLEARWSGGGSVDGRWVERFSTPDLRFPLRLRGWAPGDRIRLDVGTKKLKKLFGEERVPVRDRHRWPVVADGEGAVLWVPGVARSVDAAPRDGEADFRLGISDDDGS